jgi:hypothetical protein
MTGAGGKAEKENRSGNISLHLERGGVLTKNRGIFSGCAMPRVDDEKPAGPGSSVPAACEAAYFYLSCQPKIQKCRKK